MRYRAAAHPPPGERICAFCGSTRHVEIGHINGDECDCSPANIAWNCRSCNTKLGALFKRLGLGRRTAQFNPKTAGARNLAQWLTAVMSMKGESDQMSVPAAVAMIRATPPEDRSDFAQQIWSRRRARYGPRGRAEGVPF